MHAVIQSLHSAFDSLLSSLHSLFERFLNSPHHLMAYVAIPAILLIGVPLIRLLSRSRRNRNHRDSSSSNESRSPSVKTASPSMLGLSSPSMEFKPAPIERKPPTNVTAINESLSVPCIHCGVTMSARQNFCPGCGYAQPVRRTFSA